MNQPIKIQFVTSSNLIIGNFYLMSDRIRNIPTTWLLKYEGMCGGKFVFKPIAIIDGDREIIEEWRNGYFILPEYDLKFLLPYDNSDALLYLL